MSHTIPARAQPPGHALLPRASPYDQDGLCSDASVPWPVLETPAAVCSAMAPVRLPPDREKQCVLGLGIGCAGAPRGDRRTRPRVRRGRSEEDRSSLTDGPSQHAIPLSDAFLLGGLCEPGERGPECGHLSALPTAPRPQLPEESQSPSTCVPDLDSGESVRGPRPSPAHQPGPTLAGEAGKVAMGWGGVCQARGRGSQLRTPEGDHKTPAWGSARPGAAFAITHPVSKQTETQGPSRCWAAQSRRPLQAAPARPRPALPGSPARPL